MATAANKNFPECAFIFCAGRGERLKPLTDTAPKPLLPLGGKAVLEIILDKFIAVGIEEFIVNAWHLGEMFGTHFAASSNEEFKKKIFARLAAFPERDVAEKLKKSLSFLEYRGAQIVCVPEDDLLGQGGGLKNAIPLLDMNGALAVHNGDILLDSPMSDFLSFGAEEFKKSANKGSDSEISACLFLRDFGALKNVGIVSRPLGRVRDMRFATNFSCEKYLQFAGFFIAYPKFLEAVKNFPEKKFSTVDVMLESLLAGEDSLSYFEDNGGFFADMGTLEDYKICDRRQCLVNERFSPEGNFERVEKGGSMREFYRFKDAKLGNLVACFYSPQKRENFLYFQIAEFLNSSGFPVPEIFLHKNNVLVMRDAGRFDIGQACGGRENFKPEEARSLYSSAVLFAKKLHCEISEKYYGLLIKKNAPELSEEFSESLYEWEHNYFFGEFAKDFVKVKSVKPCEDFEKLKGALLAQKKVLLHRDMQSQNIMVEDEGRMAFIDFQGMRLGNPLYDLASLLFDPYMNLPKYFRDEMMRVYFCGKENWRKFDFKSSSDFAAFEKLFYMAGAQRLMQALGAFAFLSSKKGKLEYLSHMKFALNLLDECAQNAELLQISSLCKELSENLQAAIGRIM